jgi:hypothetical protein
VAGGYDNRRKPDIACWQRSRAARSAQAESTILNPTEGRTKPSRCQAWWHCRIGVVGSEGRRTRASTELQSGTTLTNLAGYKIYYGTDSQSLSQVVQVSSPATLSYVISGLASGTWYFAVAAYTSAGEESAQSTISTKTIG